MDAIDVLVDLIDALDRTMKHELKDLPPDDLDWQSDGEGNSIGHTTWHLARWLDVIATQVFEGKPAAGERWIANGWAERTGYDPRGVGTGGFGTITGYTPEELAAVPRLSSEDHLRYFDEAVSALRDAVRAGGEPALAEQAGPAFGTATRYALLQLIIVGELGHVGEIQALKAMRERARARAGT